MAVVPSSTGSTNSANSGRGLCRRRRQCQRTLVHPPRQQISSVFIIASAARSVKAPLASSSKVRSPTRFTLSAFSIVYYPLCLFRNKSSKLAGGCHQICRSFFSPTHFSAFELSNNGVYKRNRASLTRRSFETNVVRIEY